MIRLTSCCFHCAVTLQQQALKRSLISILVLKPLGRYLTPGKSNHALNHSCCMIPDGDFIPQGVCRKTSHTHFFQGSPFRMSFALTMLHSFPYRIAIGFGSPHHYSPCPLAGFRFSGYDFTTLCTQRIYRCAAHSGVLALVLPAV